MKNTVNGLLVAGAILATTVCHAQSVERPPMDTRVTWLTDCPHDPSTKPKTGVDGKALGLGSLIAVVGPKLIGGVIDTAAEALKAAGKDQNSVSTGRKYDSFYKVTADADVVSRFACLVVPFCPALRNHVHTRGIYASIGEVFTDDAAAFVCKHYAVLCPTLLLSFRRVSVCLKDYLSVIA